ncbi:hypothetical protein NDU88_002512 [Pleurodeles waltl]|uniref:Uncharacterized protein n=1 Tax=Pleurodeles waltl TaxID=8319 RepID=A0AAV7Q767_PLEWA|nr:hypothetical protein NDU88_002512 [Pleurodeles waltl]
MGSLRLDENTSNLIRAYKDICLQMVWSLQKREKKSSNSNSSNNLWTNSVRKNQDNIVLSTGCTISHFH